MDIHVFEANPVSSSSIGEGLNLLLTIKSMHSNGLLTLILFSALCLTGCSTLKVGGEPVAEPYPVPVAAAEPEPEPVAVAMPAPPPEPTAAPAPAPQPEPVDASVSTPQLNIPDSEINKSYVGRESHAIRRTPHLVMGANPSSASSLSPTESPVINEVPSNRQGYVVKAFADERLNLHDSGELRIWIGLANKAPLTVSGMRSQTNVLEEITQAAKVIPRVHGIDVEKKEGQCVKIKPSGSQVYFKLIPKKAGNAKVGAEIFFYDTDNCTGSYRPTLTETILIDITVNLWDVFFDFLRKLMETLTAQILSFWGALLILVSTLVLSVIRKKFKEKFGVET